MSRSFKKTPFSGCGKHRDMKNYANRVIRSRPITENIADGKVYKRYFCSWNIEDCASIGDSYETWRESIRLGSTMAHRSEWLAHKECRNVTEDDLRREYHRIWRAK